MYDDYPEEPSYDIRSASILDKTDWRKTIHRCLEECVKAEGTIYYRHAVKSLISAVSANFPGFDAKSMIEAEIFNIKKQYTLWAVDFMIKNPDYWFHPIKRKIIETKLINNYYKDIFEYIKNLLAERRILLYGVKHLPGGIQLKDKE